MASYKTRAVIINRLNLGESDRILTLFSLEYGKIKAICKGARRTKSKFSGHTELFSLSDFVISKGKSLDIINDISLEKNFFSDKPVMEKVKTIYYFSEILNNLLPDETPSREIFELTIYSLDNIDMIDEHLILLIFVARLLKILGIYPNLSSCVKCGEKPNPNVIYFSNNAGGILDDKCSVYFEDSYLTEENVVKLWRYVASCFLNKSINIKASAETVKLSAGLATSYIRCVTMIDYKSLRVLS
jgi:DNA repair protein RecO (recombination protein O)